MGFYSNVIFPRLLDWAMSREVLAKHRHAFLSDAEGEVLEIGFGTGANLPYYPSHVHHLTTVDPNPGMDVLARKRIKASSIEVEPRLLQAEALPMPDNTFDTVVSTLTMCSIPDIGRALKELYRVLKPGGRLLFLEHGLSPDLKVQVWQHRFTPVSKFIGDGCHLNRDIEQLVQGHSFTIRKLTRFYLEDTPKIAGYMYFGIATKTC